MRASRRNLTRLPHWTTRDRPGRAKVGFRNGQRKQACRHPTHQPAATRLRLASAVTPRLACDSITPVPAESPANDVAPVAANPARNERDLQVRPGLSVQPEPGGAGGMDPGP